MDLSLIVALLDLVMLSDYCVRVRKFRVLVYRCLSLSPSVHATVVHHHFNWSSSFCMLALHFCHRMSCLRSFLVKKLLNDSFLWLSANVYELPVESAGTAVENWITHFTAGRNISIKHSNSWKCYARCGVWGVDWD